MSEKKHHHYGHRQRKKEQFLRSGLDDFPDHEKLEFLLFYAIPHGDTNELAHRLIAHFGSFTAVICADYDALREIKGVGEHAASMICLFRMAARYFIMEKGGEIISLEGSATLNNYCAAMFLDAKNEQIHCVFLDSDLNLIKSEKICEGDFGKVQLSLRSFLKQVFKSGTDRVVIAHNHPNGGCIPSKNDIEITEELFKFLKKIDIELIDHIIVGKDGVWSMREHENPDVW
ncbi:MAG: DNA repair protein RadC [Oscillospiraceae bacterium]|nr:DNA repair protein RadC [Oscillospiraceae bacterium]